MKKMYGIMLVPAMLCFMIACGTQSGQGTDTAVDTGSDIEAIKAWYDLKTETTNSGNVEGLRILFTDDFIFMPPGGEIIRGWDTYIQWAIPFFNEFDVKEEISYEEIGVAGDWAFMRTYYTMKSTPKDGGETAVGNGKAIWLFKRQPDGIWKGSHCIWNENGSPPAETAE